jgi:hypothetical protein
LPAVDVCIVSAEACRVQSMYANLPSSPSTTRNYLYCNFRHLYCEARSQRIFGSVVSTPPGGGSRLWYRGAYCFVSLLTLWRVTHWNSCAR